MLETIKLAWNRIQPCTIHFLVTDPPTRKWYYLLPKNIQAKCIIYDRLHHIEIIDLLSSYRIMVASSLFEGLPNATYEAMATGALPIVSLLETS